MKKTRIGLFLTAFVLMAVAAVASVYAIPAYAEPAAPDYVQNFTEDPVDDWTKSDKGNVSEINREYLPGSEELRLTGGAGGMNAVGGSAYLSSIFYINPSVEYTDFTFTMTFRATYWLNASRWFGIMYRTQFDNDGLPGGYIFTNRINTDSSYTANVGKSFNGKDNGFNDTNHTTAKNAYTDGKYHTVTITMEGNTATHYVDGKQIGTALTTAKNDVVVGGHASGGFALLVSQCTINVKSCTISPTVTPPAAETAPQERPVSDDYSISDFSQLTGNDWSVSDKSDVANTKVSVKNGELVVKAANPNNTLYYGGLLIINPDAKYEDFTFALEFKVTPRSWVNLDRWIGIAYHTNYGTTGDTALNLAGYISNYRISGKNAYTSVNTSKTFKDDDVKEASTVLSDGTVAPVLSDGAYHKLTVTMTGNTAKHYIDGHLIREAATSTKDGNLSTTYTSGGFALIVNAMELNIKSCNITSAVTEPEQIAPIDNTIVATYKNPNVKIVNAPTVVCDVTDASVLDALGGEEKPSNAILRFNKDANVVAKDGTVLGSIADIYAGLNHQIIPVVSVADEDEADALIAYLNNVNNILDLAVVSENPALVKKVRTACPRIRGVVRYGEDDFYTDDKLDLYNNIVGKTNANLANTALIPQSMASAENVRYIQARFKTVWVYADSTRALDLHTCIDSGVFGVVASDFGAVYDVLESYPENSYTRTSYNVAHRGSFASYADPTKYPTENSIGAINEAIALGASHLEIDVHLSSDGHIVVMHDTTIDRTTTDTGAIGDMTLAQIQEKTLKDGQHIPVLEEVFEILEQHKDIVLVLELKAGATIVEAIDNLIGTAPGQYDVRDQLVIITFNNSGDDLLTDIKNIMPTVPAAFLIAGASSGTNGMVYDLASMGYYNCGLDTGYDTPVHQTDYNKQGLTDRGISSWYWTFDTMFAITEQLELGHTGITNNAAGVLMTAINRIEGVSGQKAESLAAEDAVAVRATAYCGDVQTVNGSVFFAEKVDNYWLVIASYTFTTLNGHDMTLYSMPFIVGDPTYDPAPAQPGDGDDDNDPQQPGGDNNNPQQPGGDNDNNNPQQPDGGDNDNNNPQQPDGDDDAPAEEPTTPAAPKKKSCGSSLAGNAPFWGMLLVLAAGGLVLCKKRKKA